MKLVSLIYVITFLFLSCSESQKEKEEVSRLVREWQGKTINFPTNVVYTRKAVDTLNWQPLNTDFKILLFTDSIGCMSCKLLLPLWKETMAYIDSVAPGKVSFLFFLQSKGLKDIRYILNRDKFEYPVCVDVNDELNRLNHFPSHTSFQTFLLDKDNKIVVIGNPVHNPAIKDLYLKQITGKESLATEAIRTTVEVDKPVINLAAFPTLETKKAIFTLENTGDQPLVILDTGTTCGCAVVTFDKEPAQPGASLRVYVDMTPTSTGFFDETITVKCNTDKQIKLKITGQAN